MHAEALGVPKSFHKMKKSYDIMDDQYLTAAYQGETLGSRTLPSTTLNAKPRKLTTITPKAKKSTTTTGSKHLNLICKEEADLAEINAEHAFRRLWEDNSWMYDFGTQSPDEKKRAKEMFRRNSNLFSGKGRRLSTVRAETPLQTWQQRDFANMRKHHGKIFLVDEAERPDQAKLDAQPAELNYRRALKTISTKTDKRKFKKLLEDSKTYLNEKFEGKEAAHDPRAQILSDQKLESLKRDLKDADADTDHDKEKKDKAKEDDKECDKQKENGDESEACKEKKKEEKEEEGDKKDDDDSDPDDEDEKKRALGEKKDDGKSEDVEDEEADESDAGNGESGELTDKKDTAGDDGGDRRSLEEQSEETEDGDDEEEEADKEEEKSTETKDSKDEKEDKDKKAKAKDDDKTPKKKSETKKAARRLSVEKNLVDSFVLTGRVDGLASKKEVNPVNFVKRGRRDRVLLSTSKRFDHNKPILSVSYDELKRLQQMEHTLTLKTRKLLKTLTALPKSGISLQTKIIKIYANDSTSHSPETPLQHGDSRNLRFTFLDQKEFTFIRATFRRSGFRRIRLDEGKMS
jgi:hypothetical protein